jgi:myosin-5
MQCCWRRKLARRELRRRKAEAREAVKLLQDKQALDVKLKEITAVLENVQNQRNELRQLYKVRQSSVLLQCSGLGWEILVAELQVF